MACILHFLMLQTAHKGKVRTSEFKQGHCEKLGTTKKRPERRLILGAGGEGGIRTHGTLQYA
jgi:hypothetical protein